MSFNDLQKLISPKFTKEVFDNILFKKSALSNIKVKKIALGAESKKGDSYLSDIRRYSVDITGINSSGENKEESVHVIVKVLLTNIARRKTFRSSDFFENEIIFYEKVWPVLNNFQKIKLPQSERFSGIPLLLAAYADGSNDFIALEDLSYEGYRNANRGNGVDYATTVSILHVFAQFHALCLACKAHDRKTFETAAESLKETYFDEKYYNWYHNFQENCFIVCRDAIDKELGPIYLEKFNKLIEGDFFQKICDSCRVRGPFSVITHGDAWIPNFLMHFPKGDASSGEIPEKVVLIDFQLTRYTTLINDVTFFLFSCVENTILESKWTEFIVEYHKKLVESLTKFGATKQVSISLDDLNNEIVKTVAFTIGMSSEAIIMSLLEEDEVSDLNALQGEEAVPLENVWIIKPLKTAEKRQRLALLFKMAVDKNWL